jgi:hypothetical protein
MVIKITTQHFEEASLPVEDKWHWDHMTIQGITWLYSVITWQCHGITWLNTDSHTTKSTVWVRLRPGQGYNIHLSNLLPWLPHEAIGNRNVHMCVHTLYHGLIPFTSTRAPPKGSHDVTFWQYALWIWSYKYLVYTTWHMYRHFGYNTYVVHSEQL